MAVTQKLNIKYPFSNDAQEHYFVDANDDYLQKVRSELLFTLFTQKGTRLRNPEFGSDLVKFIFDQGDSTSLEAVKTECKDSINRWVKNCTLNDIQVVKNENDNHEIFVKVSYSVKQGNKVYSDNVVVQM